MGVLSFLPLVILIFMNKNIDGKTKGIAGSIAVVAMLIAGISGVDFNPPSVEKYTEEINAQTEQLKKINLDNDQVYWTSHGNKYHVFEDCQHIKGRDQISNGTVKESFEKKGLSLTRFISACINVFLEFVFSDHFIYSLTFFIYCKKSNKFSSRFSHHG